MKKRDRFGFTQYDRDYIARRCPSYVGLSSFGHVASNGYFRIDPATGRPKRRRRKL